MTEKNEHSAPAPDDVLVESLREAYQPEALTPLRRARIRARVRARAQDDAGERRSARRSGWGLVPAAAALVGVLIAMAAVVTVPSSPPQHDPLPGDDISAASLLLGDHQLLSSDDALDGSALPPEYEALSQLLGERA